MGLLYFTNKLIEPFWSHLILRFKISLLFIYLFTGFVDELKKKHHLFFWYSKNVNVFTVTLISLKGTYYAPFYKM